MCSQAGSPAAVGTWWAFRATHIHTNKYGNLPTVRALFGCLKADWVVCWTTAGCIFSKHTRQGTTTDGVSAWNSMASYSVSDNQIHSSSLRLMSLFFASFTSTSLKAIHLGVIMSFCVFLYIVFGTDNCIYQHVNEVGVWTGNPNQLFFLTHNMQQLVTHCMLHISFIR